MNPYQQRQIEIAEGLFQSAIKIEDPNEGWLQLSAIEQALDWALRAEV